MKKFIFSIVIMLMVAVGVFAQSNYAGSSKFTDNISVTVQGGACTTFNNFCSGHTAVAPVAVIGIDKYINPWLGIGVEGRTIIGTGSQDNIYQTNTMFDAVNVSGYVKFNILNAINFDGTRKFFEPVIYTGLGWGHATAGNDGYNIIMSPNSPTIYNRYCAGHDNYMTYRVGAECNFNLGKERAWAIVVNPAVVWSDIHNGKLVKQNGSFELTAGVVYHFKTSNGTRTFTKVRLYDVAEVEALNARIAELENHPVQIVEKIVEKSVTNARATVDEVVSTWTVPFAFDSSTLSDNAKAILDKIPANSTVVVDAYASVEPKSNEAYNTALSEARANAVKEYLTSRNVTVASVTAHGMNDDFGRVAIVSYK